MTKVELLKISKKDMQKMISESNLFIQGLIRTLSNFYSKLGIPGQKSH